MPQWRDCVFDVRRLKFDQIDGQTAETTNRRRKKKMNVAIGNKNSK